MIEVASGRSRRGRLLRIVLVATGLGLVVLAIGIWLARDMPRRWLEGRLGQELDAQVRLGGLEIAGDSHFVLRELEVREPSFEPRLARVTIERLEVDSPVREVLAGRFERLVADGVEVRLAPTSRAAVPVPPTTVIVRRLELRRGRIVVEGPAGETSVDFTALLHDFGVEARGEITVSAERVDLAPWLALAGMDAGSFRGSIASPHFDLVLGRGEALYRLAGSGGSIVLGHGEREVDLGAFTLEATATPSAVGDSLHVEAHPVIASTESALVEVDLERETLRLERGRAELSGIDLSRLPGAGPAAPGRDFDVEGRGRVEIVSPDGQIFDARAEAEIERGAGPLGEGSIEVRRARAAASCGWRRGETRLSCEASANAGAASLRAPGAEVDAASAVAAGSGEIDPSTGGPLSFRLRLGEGSASVRDVTLPPELFPLELVGDGAVELGEAAPPQWRGAGRMASPGFGELGARGIVRAADTGVAASLEWSWSQAPTLSALRASAERAGFAFAPQVEFQGRPRARGTIEGLLADPALHARVDIERVSLASDLGSGIRADVGSGAAHAVLSRAAGDGGRVAVGELELRGELRLENRSRDVSWSSPLAATARGWGDALAGEAAIEEGTLDLGDLARASLAARLAVDGSVTASATLAPVGLERARASARLWLGDVAVGYTLEGTLLGGLEGARRPDGTFEARGTLELDRVGFSSEDGSRVAQGASASLELGLEGTEAGRIEGRAGGELVGPLLLWGTLYGDYSSFGSRLEIEAHRDGGSFEAKLDWALPREVRVRGGLRRRADASDDRLDYTASAEVPDLGAMLETFVQEPFEGSMRAVDRLAAAGRMLVEVAGELGGERRSVRGSLAVAGASLAGPGGRNSVAIGGLDLDLPVDLEWREGVAGPSGERREGNLRVEELRLGSVDFPAIRTPLAIAADTVRLDRPLPLEVLGGHVELEQLAFAEWSRPSRHLSFGLVLDHLSLEELSDALGLFPLEGRVNGEFPAIRLTPERLEVDGGGGIDVFGGRVEIFDISGREVLSRYPRFGFSARLSGIRLLDATQTFDFGEIEGVVDGTIDDCDLFRATPVRCAADLHSVDTPGVPQRISVKAIRNISILGAGNRIGLLDRGLQRLFDHYTYAAIGVDMRLTDDRFLLRGTARRGEKELFLKGRLPFRIDIVNVAPGNAVSFQSMLARLKNLEVRRAPEGDAPDSPQTGN